MTTQSAIAAKNAETVRAFAEAQNNVDRSAIAALLTDDATFFPGRQNASFEGREAFLDGLVGWLNTFDDGRFELVTEVYTDDESFIEWRFAAKSKEGDAVSLHGVDHFKLRDGKIVVKNSFRKA